MAPTTSSNPMLRDRTFSDQARRGDLDHDPRGPMMVPGDQMTIGGTVAKSGILLLLLAFAAGVTWDRALGEDPGSAVGLALLGGVGGFILSLVLSFKPRFAPVLAPVFAILEGLMLGAVSAWYETGSGYSGGGGYDGIVVQAAVATMAVFGTMLLLYRSRIIKVGSRFKRVVGLAMLSVVGVYLLSFVASLVGSRIPFIHDSGPIGIGFSVVVIAIASLMLLIDFDMIERGAATGAPKYMEWYGAFALLVTLVWIYLEILRLLSKLRR